MTETTLQNIADGVGDALEELDRLILEYAAASQDAARAALKPGEQWIGASERSIFGEPYGTWAHDAEAEAAASIRSTFSVIDTAFGDYLVQDAPADVIANIDFAIKHDTLTDDALVKLYELHASEWAVSQVLRKEAAHRGIYLPVNASFAAIEHKDDALDVALRDVYHRWHTYPSPLTVMPISVTKEAVFDLLRGVDIFGRPLPSA